MTRPCLTPLRSRSPQIDNFAQLGLPERLIRALAAHDIEAPFAIQRRALPDALAGKDVLGRAQTGSGKTLAFGLPLLARLAADVEPRRRGKAPRGLVLVPTRELAQQVADVLEPYGRAIGVTHQCPCAAVCPPREQISPGAGGVDVLVATPGRLLDLIDRQACTLDETEIAVLDEADHMADMGFLPEVTELLDTIPAGGQRMLFSATLDRRDRPACDALPGRPGAARGRSAGADSAILAHHRVLVTPDDQEKVPSPPSWRAARRRPSSSSAPRRGRTGSPTS